VRYYSITPLQPGARRGIPTVDEVEWMTINFTDIEVRVGVPGVRRSSSGDH